MSWQAWSRVRLQARCPMKDRKAHQEVLERLVVGDDAVVHHHELVVIAGGVRVAVDGCGAAVRRPARVPNACLRLQHLRPKGRSILGWLQAKGWAVPNIAVTELVQQAVHISTGHSQSHCMRCTGVCR